MSFNSKYDYRHVAGWFDRTHGLNEETFYGACYVPGYPRPIRVVLEGLEARRAASNALGKRKVKALELIEAKDAHNDDGYFWYQEDGQWVCRPGNKGDGGKEYNPTPKKFCGLDIYIENPTGSIRKGTSEDGHKWEVEMKYDYGFLKKVNGADGEGVDVYVGPSEDIEFVYVVHQNNPKTGIFDEDKVMLGFKSEEEAREAYLDHYDNPKFFGSMTAIPIATFKDAVNSKGDAFKWKSKRPQMGVKLEEMVSTGGIGMVPGPIVTEPSVLMSRDERPKIAQKRKKKSKKDQETKPKMPHNNPTGPRIPTMSQSGGRLGGNKQ